MKGAGLPFRRQNITPCSPSMTRGERAPPAAVFDH
jgi:hypothetical protein